jgi:quinol monooxygenase YgiN
MIHRIVKLHFEENKTEDFLTLFNQVVTKVNSYPGCISMYLLRDISNPNVFFTHSQWENEQALNEYRTSDLFQTIWPVIKPWFHSKAEAWSVEKMEKH